MHCWSYPGLSSGHQCRDTGLIVVRDERVVFHTASRLHSFNVPYQLGTGSRDRMDDGQWFNFLTRPGDVTILGTGGEWGILEIYEITSFLSYSLDASLRGGMPHHFQMMDAAKYISLQAHCRSPRTSGMSPFTREALKVGISREGGKRDDISVIVSLVVE